DLADAADVLGPVLRREPEIAVETVADVVAVQDERADPTLPERIVQRVRQCGLSGPREPGEPDGATAVAELRLALLAGHRMRVPDNIRRSCLCHSCSRWTAAPSRPS